MPFGLLETGFTAKTLTDIKEELEAEFQAAFGASINLDPEESAFGKIIGIVAEREALLWDLALSIYTSQDPDRATGAALEALAAITGTIREGATASTATLACVGTPATVLPIGRTVSVTGDAAKKFDSTAEAEIVAVAPWVALTAYVVGDRVTNDDNVYECTDAGTSAGSGGPTGTDTAIVDDGVIWYYLGEGTGAVDVEFEAQSTGPTVAAAAELITIETPVSGWNAALNMLDADVGTDIETDAALRLRRANELSAGANATLEAIRAKVLDVDDVTACTVFVNDTDTVDGDGLPAHSVEVLVLGGDDTEVATAIFESVAAGIATYGSNSETVTDDAGTEHTVYFSRPEEIEIYVYVEPEYQADEYPVDGDDQIVAAIVAYGDTFPIGKNVTSASISARVFDVDGVSDVLDCAIGIAPGPTLPTTIVITSRQLATFDTSRVTVNSAEGEY
jgi:uncharacterized phage protein gp47/JayE